MIDGASDLLVQHGVIAAAVIKLWLWLLVPLGPLVISGRIWGRKLGGLACFFSQMGRQISWGFSR